ncbi:tRNA glutamyl-Q(34) synthetase GluQRS [Sulfitobacter sp. BDSS02]|nr:tRNA glutamyl-Q(34) synthetase GluQRS [Sulfitobacter sp. BDSS02]MBR9849405.1 tRNA glutamyl-Q(34) synthetase GluQRS [Paracoccaceae bacterium]
MRCRFAPSPTGPLHLGHAYSAIIAYDLAKELSGTFLMRIEDIDRSRARSEWEQQIYDDLHWLGLEWPLPVLRQSDRLAVYDKALDDLWDRGLLYPCTCSRRDIQEAISAPQEGAASIGPDGPVYPGTCRPVHEPEGPRPKDANLRLNMRLALKSLSHPTACAFEEIGPAHKGTVQFTCDELVNEVGDIVVARRDMQTSYHLAVTVDDADQNITHVTRGLDLFEATKIHVLLQQLLGLPTPVYLHHALIRDENGKRLAKRDDARALSKYRSEGVTPADIREMIGL